jgi:hypothetical protein
MGMAGCLHGPFVVPPLGGIARVLPPKGGSTNANAVLLMARDIGLNSIESIVLTIYVVFYQTDLL